MTVDRALKQVRVIGADCGQIVGYALRVARVQSGGHVGMKAGHALMVGRA